MPVQPTSHAPIAVEEQAPAAFADPERKAKLVAAFPALDRHLAAELEAQHLPGFAFGVVIDGELAYARGFGVRDLGTRAPVDADTVFRIGSMTKTFTAAAILRLRDEGRVSLDAPMVTYLPELGAVKYPTRDATPFTMRHVLTHTSGLPRVGNFSYTRPDHDPTEAEMLQGLSDMVLGAAPGTEEVYSNYGMSLLGLVVGRVTGVRYRDYVTRQLLLPLGMTATTWDQRDVPSEKLATAYARLPGHSEPQRMEHWRLGASESAGGLYSSLRDMAKWAAFQLSAWPPRSDAESRVLSRSSLREAQTPQHFSSLKVTWSAAAEPTSGDAQATGIGLAWFTATRCDVERMVWHSGGTEGFRGSIHLVPDRGVALVWLGNLVDADGARIVDGALRVLLASGGLLPRVPPLAPSLSRAADGVVALHADTTEARWTAIAAPTFRAAVPFSSVRALSEQLRTKVGACKGPVPLLMQSATEATFGVPCERGHLVYELSVDPKSGLLLGATVQGREGPLSTGAQGACVPASPSK
jgi:CubicO group peptidase (beta-lactamase class C family)